MMSDNSWETGLPVMQVRVARAVRDLSQTRQFYGAGLGLQELASFQRPQGYSGVLYGLPGKAYHLEFTQHAAPAIPVLPPHPDNLLVLYIPNKSAIGRMVVHLGILGYHPIAPANPHWEGRSVTIPDPDGWRIVLMESAGL